MTIKGNSTFQHYATSLLAMMSVLFMPSCRDEEPEKVRDGTLWIWGYSQAALSGGTPDMHRFPEQIGEDHDWKQVSFGPRFIFAVKNDGTLWSVDTQSENEVFTLVQYGTDSDWSLVSCGTSNFFALKKDGTLWTWGDPTIQFGHGPTPPAFDPVQVNDENTWVDVQAGGWHVVAKKSDGTFWAWGANAQGQVGDGTTEMKYLPFHWATTRRGRK